MNTYRKEITQTLGQLANLETERLHQDSTECNEEIVRINNEINKRIATSHLIKEKINHLNIILEKQKKWNEQLEVDLIRAKTELKKLTKKLKKIKDLDATHIKIESTENDKKRLLTNKILLNLAQKMTKVTVNNENEGFVINQTQGSITTFHLNGTKKKNREVIWKNMRKASENYSQFNALFNSN